MLQVYATFIPHFTFFLVLFLLIVNSNCVSLARQNVFRWKMVDTLVQKNHKTYHDNPIILNENNTEVQLTTILERQLIHKGRQVFSKEDYVSDDKEIKIKAENVPLNLDTIYCYLRQTTLLEISTQCAPIINDPVYPKQWYTLPWPMIPDEQPEPPFDLNVLAVWIIHRNFGQDIKVIINDTGIQTDHPDLADNFNPEFGYNIQKGTIDPNPPENTRAESHGTLCAGIIAMVANNRICGVGISPLVDLGAVRMGQIGAYVPALIFKHTDVSITSNSYGTSEPQYALYDPDLRDNLKKSVIEGRSGFGVIHVFGSGNSKTEGVGCGWDTKKNSIFTILSTTVGSDNRVTAYSSRCPAVMVSVMANRSAKDSRFIIQTTDLDSECTDNFGFTSAGTPMVAAVLALVLRTNQYLDWRDVQHLIAFSTRVSNTLLQSDNWFLNKGGFYVSPEFGFGILDAYNIVSMAQGFHTVPPRRRCIITVAPRGGFKIGRQKRLSYEIFTDGCAGTDNEVNYIEHVQLMVNLEYTELRNLQIELLSPGKTRAIFVEAPHPVWTSTKIKDHKFLSIMSWGEHPTGYWIVDIYDLIGSLIPDEDYNYNYGDIGESSSRTSSDVTKRKKIEGIVHSLYLYIHGTKTKPRHYRDGDDYRSYESYQAKNFLKTISILKEDYTPDSD